MNRRTAAHYSAWLARNPRSGRARTPATRDTGNNGEALTVEFLIDGLWTDISTLGYVLYRGRVEIQSGRSGEGTQADPGTCSFELRNTEGAPFSAGNPASPYWGKVGRGTRVRVSVPDGMVKSYRFWGEVADLEEDSDTSGNDASVQIRAAGPLDRLQRNDAPLKSAFRRMITSPDPAGTRTVPLVYWPMEDGTNATFCAPAVGNEPMNFTGSPSLAALSTFACSDAIPNVSGSKFAGYVPNYTVTTTKPNASSVWWLMDADSTLTVGTLLVRVVTQTHRWELVYVSADNLRLRIIDFTGAIIYDSGSVACDITNKRRWFCIGQTDPEGDGAILAWLESEAVGSDVFEGLISATPGIAGSAIQYVQFNPLEVATEFYIGHVAVFNHKPEAVNCSAPYAFSPYSLNAYVDERADSRFGRLCTEAGIPFEVINPLTDGSFAGTFAGAGQRMGTQGIKSLINHLRDCEEADGGILYERRDEYGLGYRTLTTMCNQAAAVSLSHGNHELSEQPKPLRNTRGVTNDVTVTRDGGATFNSTDLTGPMGADIIGRFTSSKDLDLSMDAQARDRAAWELHLGTVTDPRFESITTQLAHPSIAGTSLRSQILGVRPGDRIDITDLPARISYDDLPELVFGFKETIDQFLHSISWNVVPERPYRIAEIGTDGYDRMDAEDSRLAVDANDSATTLTVNSYDGSRWIDSAGYADKFPFDIKINGERMTVTAITGVTQDAFTRSVSDSWGTADVGGDWSTQGGASTDFDVNGTKGTVLLNTVNVSRRTILQTNAPDIDQYVDISTDQLSTGASQSGALFGRSLDTNNKYIARLEFTTAAAVILSIRKRVAGVETELATRTLSITHVANTPIRLRFKIDRSLLQAKAWPASAAQEPTAWDVTATDTDLDNARDVGTRAILFAGNTNVNPVVSYDNYMGVAGQYFTVTRGVNGLTRAHLTGSEVHIFDIVYMGL